jgi:hypothetical protein
MAVKALRSSSTRPNSVQDAMGRGRPSGAKHFNSSTASGPKGILPVTPGPSTKLPSISPGQSASTPARAGGNTVATGRQASKAHSITPPARPTAVDNRRTDGPPSPAHGSMAKG